MTNIDPKWANSEWCIENDNDPECATYLKLTNVGGGPSSSLQYIDLSCTSGTDCDFKWSDNPRYSWFLTPTLSEQGGDPESKMFLWDETIGGNKDDPTMRSNLTKAITFDDDLSCISSTYSNTEKCEVGHGNYISGYNSQWDPQVWGTGPNKSECSKYTKCKKDQSDFTCQQYWLRGIGSGSHGGTFCNWVNQWSVSGQGYSSCIDHAFMFSGSVTGEDGPADVTGGDANGFNWGCNIDSCSATSDFYNTCNNQSPVDLNASSWISDNAAASCCALPANNVYAYPQCGSSSKPGAFSATATGSKCPELMDARCENIWPVCAENPTSNCQTGDGYLCQSYLTQGGNSAISSSRTMISDYVNSSQRGDIPDYISWKLKNAGDPTSSYYYSSHNCTKDPSTYSSSSPCSRDDSTDPFFTQQIYYYCTTPETGKCTGALGNPNGNCDDILHYMCQDFDRESLEADPTLAKMCGCFLMSAPQANSGKPYSKPDFSWTDQYGTPQKVSPYYLNVPDGEDCDPMCMTANGYTDSIVPCSGKCVSSSCVMDDITLNYYNTNAGDVTLDQACGDCEASEGGQCVCYMNDITINSLNSTFGGTQIDQTCGSCYYTDPSGTPVPVDCATGEPINPDDDNGKSPGDLPWWKRKLTLIMAVVIILAIVLFIGFWYSSYHRYKVSNEVDSGVASFDDYYYY